MSAKNDDDDDGASKRIQQTGQCLCGAVRFTVTGTIAFNALCHCRACGRARGMTPVHLIGVQDGDFTFHRGQDDVKTVTGLGSLQHTFCTSCGAGLYQQPAGHTDFYAVFPTTFQLETVGTGSDGDGGNNDVPSCILPPQYQPKEHHNYENRLYNYYDLLPKYKTFAGSPRMNNEGQVIRKA